MKTYAAFRRSWEPSPEGERHEAIDEFVETRLARYADNRDFPGRDATSRLSPRIASGEITIADCTAAALAAPPSKGREKWLDELCWHDWFEHVKSTGLDAPRLEPRWDTPGERFERWETCAKTPKLAIGCALGCPEILAGSTRCTVPRRAARMPRIRASRNKPTRGSRKEQGSCAQFELPIACRCC